MPEEQILWVTYGRQGRADIDRHDFENEYFRNIVFKAILEAHRQGHDDEEGDVVRLKGRQCGRKADQQKGQPPFRHGFIQDSRGHPAQKIAFSDARRDDENAGQGTDRVPLHQSVITDNFLPPACSP